MFICLLFFSERNKTLFKLKEEGMVLCSITVVKITDKLYCYAERERNFKSAYLT